MCGLKLLDVRQLNLNFRAVTMFRIAPRSDRSIWQDSSKCCTCSLDMPWSAALSSTDLELQSCHHRILDPPMWQQSRLQGWQQTQRLSRESVARSWADLGHQCYHHQKGQSPMSRQIWQDSSKCTKRGCNLLHATELVLDLRAVSTIVWIAPSEDRSIFEYRSKRAATCRPNLANTPQLIWDCRVVTGTF